MDQLRQVGRAIGNLKTYMVFRKEILINQRQCCLLFDAFNLAFDVIIKEIKQHLRFNDKKTKWQALENPLKEFHRVIKEGEYYIKQCLESKDWWVQAITLNLSTDCVEFHLHNLLWCLPILLEAIENVVEISGQDSETIQWKRIAISKKYERVWMEPKLFFHCLANHYLVSQEMRDTFNSVWKEDRWLLSELISKKTSKALPKHVKQVAELLMAPRDTLHPTSILVGSKDYQPRRRLGSRNLYKEVQWMGESFALHHCVCDFDSMSTEISLLTSVMHPNVLNYMYAFSDDQRKEYFILMELMNNNLYNYIKENTSERRRVPFPVHIALDIMIQIARGMEYLHSKKLYHGDLNPSNILVKSRNYSSEGYMHVKISGFGQSNMKVINESKKTSKETDMIQCIWCAPEVLAEQEQFPPSQASKYTEKADVYSFAMICFELLTGKVPFEDDHLQGDKMSRSIKAGSRPLFPATLPKYLTNLTKKCWHTDPSLRPSFSSICRILRYTKKFLIMNPEKDQQDKDQQDKDQQDKDKQEPPIPPVDYIDIEMSLTKKFKEVMTAESLNVSEIPFQMFCYRVLERERINMNIMDRTFDSGSEQTPVCGDDTGSSSSMIQEKALSNFKTLHRSVSQPEILLKSPRKPEMKTGRLSVQLQRGGGRRPSPLQSRGRSSSLRSESSSHTMTSSPSPLGSSSQPLIVTPSPRSTSGHESDSEQK